MPGGGGYLVRIHKEKKLLIDLGNEKKIVCRERKNIAPSPVYRMTLTCMATLPEPAVDLTINITPGFITPVLQGLVFLFGFPP